MATKTATAPAAETKTVEDDSWKISDLLDHIEKQTGKAYAPATIRVLLRKLAKEGSIERGEGRWSFEGADDPAVIAIVDAVSKGRADKDVPEEDMTDPEAPKPAAKKTRAKKAPAKKAPEPVEDDEEELDLEDL